MFTQSCSGVGSTWCQPFHFKDNNQWSHTFQTQASLELPKQDHIKEVCHQNVSRYDSNDSGFKRQKDFGVASSNEFGFYFKNVFGEKTRRRTAPYIRLKKLKQVCSNQTFPINISGGCDRILAERGLASKDRFATGIFPCTNSGNTPAFFTNSIQSRSTAANGTAFWPLFCPPDVLCPVKLDSRAAQVERNQTSCLPRRSPPCQPGSRQTCDSDWGNLEYPREPRLVCQSPEVYLRSLPRAGVFRHSLEHAEQHHVSSSKENIKDKVANYRAPGKELVIPQRTAKLTRDFKFRQPDYTKRTSTLSSNANISERVYTRQTKTKKKSFRPRETRPSLVARSDRNEFDASSQERSDSLPDNRRCRRRMGCAAQRKIPVRKVVQTSEILALQHEGNVRRVRYDKSPADKPSGGSRLGSVGQQNLSGAHSQRRRHKIACPARANVQANGVGRAAKHQALSGVPPGEVQWHSRPLVKRPTSARVAFVAPGLGGRIREMGRSRGRLIRFKQSCRRAPVRVVGLQRWVSNFLRRLQSTLEVQSGLGVPASKFNSTSTSSSQLVRGNIHCNSPTLDSMFLAHRSQDEVPYPTSSNQGPSEQPNRHYNGQESPSHRETGTDGLESWGWCDQIAHWSIEERSLLSRSWRESTLATYRAPIKRWTSWCTTNKIDSKAPCGNDVARFLAKLYLEEKLAYRTILLHKSAISTYCATAGEEISKNFFVQQILKAISLIKPQEIKGPIWDTKLLFDWLINTPDPGTLFETSRRTALILLLASGRRIHDLTLLQVPDDDKSSDNDQLCLWPRFGSKTDNLNFRQSGWLLKSHPNQSLCPVRYVRQLVQMTEGRRSDQNQTGLFVSITGICKPATRTMLAGWIKSIFKEAGIDAPPGSVRSAVASRSWMEKRPIEEIMKRANWKNAQTFYKFYCKEVEKETITSNQDLLYGNFSVI